MTHISRRQLEVLSNHLSDRDREVLASLRTCRYLTTSQIQRLHFNDHLNHTAALRAANRSLARIKDHGLIGALSRRIGGVRAGSGSLVWVLTEAGFKLLQLDTPDSASRKRFFEPSPAFLAHTLAVSEAYLQLVEIGRTPALQLVKVQLEPDCWRDYVGEDGKPTLLKPDLYAVTACGEYEDSWFIEVDLNTEAPTKVLEKCRRYIRYYRLGAEQKQHGVFPRVVWIVPSVGRRDNLRGYIAEAFGGKPDVFTVITPDELSSLIQSPT